MNSMVVYGRHSTWEAAVHMTEDWQEHPMRPPIRLVVLSIITQGLGDDERIISYTFHGADGNVYRQHLPTDQWYVHTMCPEGA